MKCSKMLLLKIKKVHISKEVFLNIKKCYTQHNIEKLDVI